MRYFIELSYAGTNYHGWQSQPNAVTIQEQLEKALSLLLRSSVKITGAGRTDAGVHARQMFAHFDTEILFDPDNLIYKLNSFLSNDIAIYKIFKVHSGAHARFDAVSRSYSYYMHRKKNPFFNDFSWYFKKKLNLEQMNEAAQKLLLYDDFKSFSKTHTDVKTYICHIERAFWEQKNEQLIFHITADRFLRNMVRAVVGTLFEVGLEKLTVDDFEQIIKARDRNKAGFSVPAHGLFLEKIVYPSKIFI